MRLRQFLPVLLLAAALLPACGDHTASGQKSANARDYTVRGTIVQVMDPRVGHEVMIEHEAIPNFIDAEGESTLMPPMTMPFTVADDVNLSGLTKGTPVEFTLQVDWQASPPIQITAMKVVPAGE
jgi:Cu/Ag efflux protein CusF